MCGINGILKFRNSTPCPHELLHSNIAKMNSAIAHRGPDGDGVYVADGVALGHRRLAILDLSAEGNQPMFNEDSSLVLVFNGEIYNYLELIPELKARGHIFRSHSDSEVILHAYEEWGESCVTRFNGMWAFAIWDTRRRRLFASRDRLGVKPFYFTQDLDQFIFSSEIKGIVAVKPMTEANLEKVHDYLAYGYRTNDGTTFFSNINELMPGHNLVIEGGIVRQELYWSLPERNSSNESDDQLREHFRFLLEDAVRLRFRSDVPVALLQSGGLDSSTICRIVDDSIEAGQLGCESVTAFTASFPGYKYDEYALVKELIGSCRHVQLQKIETNEKNLAKYLLSFVGGMGEPMFNSNSFVHWQIMRTIHEQGIKVVINGQGADEALAGYGPLVVGYRLLDLMLSRPGAALKEAAAVKNKMGLSYSYQFSQTIKAMLGRRAASKWRGWIKEGTLKVLDGDFHRKHDAYLTQTNMTFSPNNLDRHLRAQIEHYGFNQILQYEDHSAMLNSIEIRSPFVDYRLMELAFTLPDRLKLNEGVTKRIQREAFSGRLPARISDNHIKIGFATPFERWMQTPEMQSFVSDMVQGSSFMERSIWKSDKLRNILTNPSENPGFPFWRFINMELWAREYGITNL